MLNFVRHKVSLNKNRYIKDGFDLDLTYITPTIMAMGFPAVGVEAMYRNPRPQVQKLLEKVHKDKYKVYNLCAEPKWSYSPDVFHERVGRYPFHDHQAPPLELMGQFCKDVEDWLSKEEGNIAAVHCKAGKGRAGMMICCWLIHSQTYPTADEAMKQYGMKRTRDGKGVTIPSQRRYVRYYEDIVKFGLPDPPKIKVKNVLVQTSHYSKSEPGEPWIEILSEGKEKLYASKPEKVKGEDLKVDVNGVEIKGDIKINVYDSSRAKKGKPICHFWFNTAWIENNKLVLNRIQIDKAWNDKKFKVFQKDFDITVEFEGAEVSTISKMTKKTGSKKSRSKSDKKSKREKKENGKTSSDKNEQVTNVEKKEEDKVEKAEKIMEMQEVAEPEKNQQVKDNADTVVFISNNPIQSPQSERKDSSDSSSSSEAEAEEPSTTKDQVNPQTVVSAVPTKESSDDSSSSTDSSEESSGVEQQQPAKITETKVEETQPTQNQESSDDSSSTNSSEESSEGEPNKVSSVPQVVAISSDEEKDKPAPKQETKDSSSDSESDSSEDSSSSEAKEEKKGSAESSESDL